VAKIFECQEEGMSAGYMGFQSLSRVFVDINYKYYSLIISKNVTMDVKNNANLDIASPSPNEWEIWT